jgi:CheY-like chemotaxis protein
LSVGEEVKPSVLVLIAENEPDIRLVLQDAFEDGGFDVLLASSGEEAIAALDAERDNVRALLTDINLESKSTGWDVARHARELNPDLPSLHDRRRWP